MSCLILNENHRSAKKEHKHNIHMAHKCVCICKCTYVSTSYVVQIHQLIHTKHIHGPRSLNRFCFCHLLHILLSLPLNSSLFLFLCYVRCFTWHRLLCNACKIFVHFTFLLTFLYTKCCYYFPVFVV